MRPLNEELGEEEFDLEAALDSWEPSDESKDTQGDSNDD